MSMLQTDTCRTPIPLALGPAAGEGAAGTMSLRWSPSIPGRAVQRSSESQTGREGQRWRVFDRSGSKVAF